MHPEIHFSRSELRHKWEGQTFTALKEAMNTLRKKVKEATGYFWDNDHYFIDDTYGRPALKIMFQDDCVSIWSARNDSNFGSLRTANGIIDRSIFDSLDVYVDNVAKGLTQCSDCADWVEKFKRYSFAGAVCETCYNPSRHKGPDTRGD
jgi:hypothetical protein